ncbi:MAG: GNAT family N-acetyltransferase [Pseudomonadota bacterium]
MLTVRPFDGDVAALIDLFRTTVRSVNLGDYTEDQVRAWAPDIIDETVWAKRIAANTCYLAEIDGSLAGFTELTSTGHVEMLFVAKDRQRRGVASALLAHAENEARAHGLSKMTTEASLTARPVFERHGYSVVKRQEVSRGGQTLANFVMEKPLA